MKMKRVRKIIKYASVWRDDGVRGWKDTDEINNKQSRLIENPGKWGSEKEWCVREDPAEQ